MRALPQAAWDGPGLGEWDLRALVGHTSRSLTTVSAYLRTETDHEDALSAADYYMKITDFAADAGPAAIVERGRQAGRELGADPPVAIAGLVRAALDDVAAVDDPLMEVIGGIGIRLSNYLPTRVFELVVHGLDIARATGVEYEPPKDALTAATALAAELAVTFGRGQDVLLALTGRASLPEWFSVV